MGVQNARLEGQVEHTLCPVILKQGCSGLPWAAREAVDADRSEAQGVSHKHTTSLEVQACVPVSNITVQSCGGCMGATVSTNKRERKTGDEDWGQAGSGHQGSEPW